MDPTISIVLCTYNGEKFLATQLESIFSQTYKNIELVISDDASTDGTRHIINSYATKPNVITKFNTVNIGYAKNFESAMQLASGQYIALCDQDDVWMQDKIEILVAGIGNYFMAYSDSLLVNEQGASLHKKLSDISNMYTGNSTRGFMLWNVVWGHTVLFKKELLLHSIPIPSNVPHDIWLAFKATTLGGIVYINKPLTHYRQHNDTITTLTYGPKKATPSRKKEEKAKEFAAKLHWFTIIADNERESEMSFYKKLVAYYQKKQMGFAWALFFFMIKHRKDFFKFRKKNLLSELIEIRKQCRHVLTLNK